MLARAQGRDGCLGMERHGQRDVDGVDSRIGDGFFHRGPRLGAGKLTRLGCIARDESVEHAARLRLNGGNDALARNVADAGKNPMQFVAHAVRISCRRELTAAKKPPVGGFLLAKCISDADRRYCSAGVGAA